MEAEVSEAYANRIKAGNELQVSLPDLKLDFKSKVRVVSKAIDPTNRTFKIEAEVPKDIPVRPNLVAIITESFNYI
ncbi:MAG: HlyD family efflux transporter periplasmic adaptor subunit [Sphingobacteriales bacterium]|nr:MAG: HlyD family efflux transporter periplasmic adaptor subunit [Sphingobacteriales bacterium]